MQINKSIHLGELIDDAAAKFPNNTAYIFLDGDERNEIKISWKDLRKKIITITAYLRSEIKSGERALLIYPPGIELIQAFVSCLYSGIIPILVYPPYNEDLIIKTQLIVDNANPCACLMNDAIYKRIKDLNFLDLLSKVGMIKKINKLLPDSSLVKSVQKSEWRLGNLKWINTDCLHAGADASLIPLFNKKKISFLQYTSGSTGDPKGVIVTHDNLLSNLETIRQNFHLSNSSKTVFWLPPYHDMGLIGGIMAGLYNHHTSVLMTPLMFIQRPLRWLLAISNYRATISGGPNFAFDMCVDKISSKQLEQLDLSSWELAFNGAEPLHYKTLERFIKKFKPCGFKAKAFFPCYGLAEATLLVTNAPKGKGATILKQTKSASTSKLVSSGCAAKANQLFIVDPNTLKTCKEEVEGEIWLAGKNISPGYWKDPKKTNELFNVKLEKSHELFLRTGDLGFIKDKQLYVTGRIKDLIIIQGKNYYPHDIEAYIGALSNDLLNTKKCIAFSINHEFGEKLIIVIENKSVVDEKKFQQFCHEACQLLFQQYGIESDIIILSNKNTIKKTTSGKLRRHYLRSLYLDKKIDALLEWINPKLNKVVSSKNKTSRVPASTKSSRPSELNLIQNDLISWIHKKTKEARNRIDIDANIQSFGLHSMLMVEFISDIEKKYNLTLSPTDIIQYNTIRALSRYLVDVKNRK